MICAPQRCVESITRKRTRPLLPGAPRNVWSMTESHDALTSIAPGESGCFGIRSPNKSDAIVGSSGVSRSLTISDNDWVSNSSMEIFIWDSYR